MTSTDSTGSSEGTPLLYFTSPRDAPKPELAVGCPCGTAIDISEVSLLPGVTQEFPETVIKMRCPACGSALTWTRPLSLVKLLISPQYGSTTESTHG